MKKRNKTLVIGLGNPILGDDGVGWHVAQDAARALEGRGEVEVDCAAVGGLGLMEHMIGYAKVILVDAIATGGQPAGAVNDFPLEALGEARAGHTGSAHDTSLVTALEAAKALGADVPGRVHVVSIEARGCDEFSEGLSEAVAAAVPEATQRVLELLRD